MSMYSKAVEAGNSNDQGMGPMPCSRCRTLTLRADLAQYGARCLSCYEAYCREPMPVGIPTDKRLGPREWARVLEAREATKAGRGMTLAQRDMWRAGVGFVSQAEEVEGA